MYQKKKKVMAGQQNSAYTRIVAELMSILSEYEELGHKVDTKLFIHFGGDQSYLDELFDSE